MTEITATSSDYGGIHGDIVALLEAARRAAARNVNALMTATYWEIGRRIVKFEQGGEDRATYGEALIKRLGADLSPQFGRGFGWRNLAQMRAFYLTWPTHQILQMLSAISQPGNILPRSAMSANRELPESSPLKPPDLPTLAQAFPLPWSAYVRLLSVKKAQARAFLRNRGPALWLVGAPARPADRQPVLRTHRAIAQQGSDAGKG